MNFEATMELEAQIRAAVQKDNISSVNFHYETSGQTSIVKVFTYNVKTKEFFLLMSASGTNNVSCLEQVLAYVTTHKNEMSSYTVRWSRKSEGTVINESHFFCKSIKELVEKFYEGKDEAMYIVYEIQLNPIS